MLIHFLEAAASGTRPAMFSPSLVPPASLVTVGASKWAVESAGASRVPLVMLHGFQASRLDFLDVRGPLCARRRVLGVDQRGHGASTRDGPFVIGQLVQDLAELLKVLGESEIDLLGHSMGGMVALRFALEWPERVRSLILCNTTPGPFAIGAVPPPSPAWRRRWRNPLETWLRRDAVSAMVRELNASPEIKRRFEAITRYHHAQADLQAVHDLAQDISGLDSVEDRLGALRVPTLVLVGLNDQPFLAPSETLASKIPGARWARLADAGHCAQFENRAGWLQAVSRFLQDVDTGKAARVRGARPDDGPRD